MAAGSRFSHGPPPRGAGVDQSGAGQHGGHPPHHHRIGRHRRGQFGAGDGAFGHGRVLVRQIGEGVGRDGEFLAV